MTKWTFLPKLLDLVWVNIDLVIYISGQRPLLLDLYAQRKALRCWKLKT